MEKSVQTLEKFVPTREKNFGSKLSTSLASATEGVITGKTYEHCWLCRKSHFNNQPCSAQQESSSNDQDWDTSNWQEQLNMVSPSKNNTLRKQNTKQKTKKANKVLTMARSHLIESDTTAYKIENGDKEEVYDRTDLTMLPLLDREARRNIVGSSDDESYHNRRLHVRNNSPLTRCPNEILEKILTYAADEYASDRKTKVKDIIAGHDFGLDDGVSDNMRRARNLAGAAKSCRQLRLIAQRIIYKVVIIDKYKPLRKFALSLTTDPELGKMVQVFRVNLLQTNQSYKNRGFFKYQMDNRNVVSNTDFASLFVRVVESCPNLQVLSVKMYGSILGFGAVRGKFTKMREICISDPVSSGMVLNQMWNHLTDFPQLQKFKMVHSEMNDGVNFEPLEIPHHFADKALDFTFKDLSTLTLENAPEVSDELLVFLVRRFTALNKLAIVNCKLVSSGGLARVLEEIPGRLSTLVFWVWLDQSGCPSAREIKSSRYHLCSAISGYGETLSVLNMKPYRLCEDMWKGPGFKRLHRCNIDMMQFCHCRNEDNSRDESSFEAAYKVAQEEERLPHLDESSAIFHLRE
ncbi:hypothetical protein BDD12DRAFT_81256 [Trichophaea hybrida]|nr:hypothetical protein BDD12DRAFT_81256 [Trichophaea hybrida]